MGIIGCGSGRRIRTLANRVRVCRATVTQFRSKHEHYYNKFRTFVKYNSVHPPSVLIFTMICIIIYTQRKTETLED